MKTQKAILVLTLALAAQLLAVRPALAELHYKRLPYKIKSTTMTGLLAWDDSFSGPRPGVVVLHDSLGLSVVPFEYADTPERMCMEERRCLDLAALGYVALAADLYADARPKSSVEAIRNIETILAADPYELERSYAVARAVAAVDALIAQPQVDAARIVCIGWGQGGLVSLQLAARDSRVKGICAWYPYVQKLTRESLSKVKCPVLVLLGREDDKVFSRNYRVWLKDAKAAGMTVETHYYKGATHGFGDLRWKMQPKTDAEMKPERAAAEQAWKDSLEFFNAQIGPP